MQSNVNLQTLCFVFVTCCLNQDSGAFMQLMVWNGSMKSEAKCTFVLCLDNHVQALAVSLHATASMLCPNIKILAAEVEAWVL